MNLLCASVTTRNKDTPKYLYWVFCTSKRLDLTLRLKLEGLLARINSEFIGFQCLNMFEFTKMAFFE